MTWYVIQQVRAKGTTPTRVGPFATKAKAAEYARRVESNSPTSAKVVKGS